MADKAIKRDGFETLQEAGYSAAKGGLLGVGIAFAIGAAATMGLGIVGAGIYAGLATDVAVTWGSALAASATGIAITSAVVGAAVAVSEGVLFGAVGGIVGLIKGASKVSRENAMYASKANEKIMGKEAEMMAVHNNAVIMTRQEDQRQAEQAMQQVYMAGQQAGEQKVLAQLQEHAKSEQHHVPHKHEAHAGHQDAHAHKHEGHEQPAKSFAAAETNRRQAAAAAGAQVGA